MAAPSTSNGGPSAPAASSSSAPAMPPQRPAKRATIQPPSKPKDPAIERALSLSTFESGYSIEDFISVLSERVISESKSNAGPFDPKPFLQTFSPALDSLLALRGQVAERTKKMETDVRRAEREYGRRLRELDGGFEAIGSSFSSLESKITDVGRTAVRIGEQLESLHQTRSTAQSTSLILSYYLSLSHQTSTTADPNNPDGGKNTPLEALFASRTSREGRARLAIILRRLAAVAKDVADNAATAVSEAEAAALGAGSETAAEAGAGAAASGAESGREKDKEKKDTSAADAKLVLRRRKEKEKADRVKDEVERYCERFEKEVLRLFDRSYRKGDPRMMAHCARTLQDFNGGASCVQIYVNQHDFFISHGKVVEDAEKSLEEEDGVKRADIWKTIGDPDAIPPTGEPGLDALIREIKITTSQEAQIVKAVFPNPIAVATVFLQRVFAQVLQQHIEHLVNRAQSISTLAVLRILNLCHASCAALVEELKTYDAILASGAGPAPSATASASSGATGTKSGNTAAPLAGVLDHAMEEMFVPWCEGSRYLESESKNLVELFGGLLSRFTRYHETVQKAKPNSLLDKVVNQISGSSTTSTSNPSQQHITNINPAQSAASAISKYANLFASSAAQAVKSAANASVSPNVGISGGIASPSEKRPSLPNQLAIPNNPATSPASVTSPTIGVAGGHVRRQDSLGQAAPGLPGPSAEDGLLTIAAAERMLRWHAESVGRVVELSQSGEVGRNAFALSKVLAEAIGRGYIETALDSSIARLDQHDNKAETDLQPLLVLKSVDQICHLWQRYTSTALLPLSAATVGVRREMNTFNSHGLVRMEGKINTVIQKTIDAVIASLRHFLTRQKKNDYKPVNDEISFARNQTEPCQLCCELIDHVRVKAKQSLSGKNLEGFLTEVGAAFHSLLLDHYKKFPVNPTGGLMLTKDLAAYQEAAASFGLPAINDRFDMLRQLGNSFIVQPNVLKSYMTESHLGRIELKLLRPYLQQRVDYSTFAKSLNLEEAPINLVPSAGGSSGSDSDKNKNRLSTISGVAGVGMGKLKGLLKEFEISPEEQERIRKENMKYGAYGSAAGGRYMGGQVFIPMH